MVKNSSQTLYRRGFSAYIQELNPILTIQNSTRGLPRSRAGHSFPEPFESESIRVPNSFRLTNTGLAIHPYVTDRFLAQLIALVIIFWTSYIWVVPSRRRKDGSWTSLNAIEQRKSGKNRLSLKRSVPVIIANCVSCHFRFTFKPTKEAGARFDCIKREAKWRSRWLLTFSGLFR